MHMSNTCTHVNGNKNMGFLEAINTSSNYFSFSYNLWDETQFSSNIYSFNDALQYMQQYLSYIDWDKNS